jgi:16S rRNA processing protein RimM
VNPSEPVAPRIELGRLLRPVGIRGEVKLLPSPDFWPAALDSGRLLLVSGAGERPVRVTASRPLGECLVLRLAGTEDRNGAEALRDAELWLAGEPDVELPEQPRAWQLTGMKVLLAAGSELGAVLGLEPKPGQALLQVKGGTKVYEIPFVAPILCGIDWEARTITIDPPDGLLEL